MAAHTTGKANLQVNEQQSTAKVSMPCTISPRTEDGKFPVFVRRKKTGDIVQRINICCEDVVDKCKASFELAEGNPRQILCELKGVCHVKYALQQEVQLNGTQISSTSTQPEVTSISSHYS